MAYDGPGHKEDGVRLLIIAPEPITAHLAGPGIRSLMLAQQLSRDVETTLAVPQTHDLPVLEAGQVCAWTRQSVLGLLANHDVVLSQGMQYPARGCLPTRQRRIVQVFDLHNPVMFEILADQYAPHAQLDHLQRLTAFLLQRGDYFLCASPQQRTLWLGALYVCRRLTAQTFEDTLDQMIGIVPFGHAGAAPQPTRPVLKGVIPGIAPSDKVLLWGGGVWNWFDPLTLIRAMAAIGQERQDVKLFFMGTHLPQAANAPNQMASQAQSLARELGLLGRSVFFHDTWVPFAERGNYLLEADLAVCTAPQGLENAFAFRTRLVDALWAGVPIVCTREGFFADYVTQQAIGLTVASGDVPGLAQALVTALRPDRQACFRANIAACRDDLHWERCVQPLRDFCQRVAHGEYQRPAEPSWRPWIQYLRYKMPTVLEYLRGHEPA